jgi:RNA polymerase sigma-70 factor (ECF subfamily)
VVYAKVRRYFLLRGLDAMTAEDLAQNVMFITYRRAGDVREKELFYGWLFKVARNELLQHWRRHRADSETVAFEPLRAELSARLTTESSAARHSLFSEWMGYLEREEREILRLRFIEELSYEELAAALGLPLGTVKWRIFNAKKKLARVITAPAGEAAKRRARL